MQSRTRSGKGPGDDACFGLVRILVYNIITDEPWPGFTVDQLRSHLGYALQLRQHIDHTSQATTKFKEDTKARILHAQKQEPLTRLTEEKFN